MNMLTLAQAATWTAPSTTIGVRVFTQPRPKPAGRANPDNARPKVNLIAVLQAEKQFPQQGQNMPSLSRKQGGNSYPDQYPLVKATLVFQSELELALTLAVG